MFRGHGYNSYSKLRFSARRKIRELLNFVIVVISAGASALAAKAPTIAVSWCLDPEAQVIDCKCGDVCAASTGALPSSAILNLSLFLEGKDLRVQRSSDLVLSVQWQSQVACRLCIYEEPWGVNLTSCFHDGLPLVHMTLCMAHGPRGCVNGARQLSGRSRADGLEPTSTKEL